MNKRVKIKIKDLEIFVINVLKKCGLNEEDAKITCDVLLLADKRGIESHGVARLKRYVNDIKQGTIRINNNIKIIKETPVSIVIDGEGGMGQPIAYKTMKQCIEKAKKNLICFATIRNSNHYGIAGYYTLMALKEDMIGISLTNSAPLVVPTFAKDAVIGTNPISVGIPTNKEKPFLLDMATSTVPRGKLEVYARLGEPISTLWATDENGIETNDASKVLTNLINRQGGGLSPLGGSSELTGGHKGYGLGVLVDIFSGIFSSGAVGTDVYVKKGEPSGVCHFLGVINPEAFSGIDVIKKNMDYYIKMLKDSEKCSGQNRIYIAGEKEFESEKRNADKLNIQDKVFSTLNLIGKEFNLELNVT